MGGSIGNVTKNIGRGLGAVATGGMSEIAPKSLFGKAGNAIGSALTLNPNGMNGNGGGKPGVPGNPDQISPMQALQQTGGAPLLAGIAMGADVNQSLMSFFGASGDFNQWMATLDPASQNAIKGLSTQLTSISQSTEMKSQAVKSLVNDFPDFMASAIPKYTGMIDKQTQDAAQQALSQVSAKYAANGGLSSGAMAAASARTAAYMEQGNTEMGMKMAGQDWSNRFNQSNAINEFQRKMLGQGASDGFNAMQNMWGLNAKQGMQTQELQFKKDTADRNASGALGGAFGKVGGGIIGGYLGGPMGAAAGSDLGGALGTYAGGQQ